MKSEDVARRKVIGLIGLGLRGRLAVVGVQQVRDAAKRGRLRIALVASDASQNSLDKIAGLLAARGVAVNGAFSSSELGAVAGRDAVAVIGVLDAGLARGIVGMIPPGSWSDVEDGRTAARQAGRQRSRR